MNKSIRKEQIVQLREHDMNRGHNKSKTPVYPVTVPEAILGFDSLGGATIVETLPETGQAGIIYYNTEDSNYYVYTENGFKEFGAQEGLPIVRNPAVHKLNGEEQEYEYDLEPNKYYVFGRIGGTAPQETLVGPDGVAVIDAPSLTFHVSEDSYIVKSYVGRFIANADSPSITLVGAHFADDIPDIESGHTYEFNILYGICLITDITYTSNG